MIDPSSQTALLVRLMEAGRMRTDVIAQNVANVNTPGHQNLEVQFEDALTKALASKDKGQLAALKPTVQPGAGGTPRADGNNVDIDKELGRLQKNEVMMELYAQLLTTQFGQYRSAISGH